MCQARCRLPVNTLVFPEPLVRTVQYQLISYLQVMLVAIHPWDCAGAKQVSCMDL